MWWLFQERPQLLRETEQTVDDEDLDDLEMQGFDTTQNSAAAHSTDIHQMTEYLWRSKKIPAELPLDLTKTDKDMPLRTLVHIVLDPVPHPWEMQN